MTVGLAALLLGGCSDDAPAGDASSAVEAGSDSARPDGVADAPRPDGTVEAGVADMLVRLDSVAPSDPVGGWSGVGLFACFSRDGRAAFGDRLDEIKTACCSWKADGTFQIQSKSGSWRLLDGNTLRLEATAPCGDGGCVVTYTRDDTLPCFFK